ncbi:MULTISPECIES: family 43 glycosylhydrolase [Streptomyces]|uniref:Putative secreted hydrolase n=5 Tax=Streptomyces scabiei TaxID=1930 RepID=C9Z507_STRSW|nr:MULTISPECIES: family 43 glycosylhydrolase [Streptomyces]MBP5927280.1 family 43 glycosylhydrolase [Streptomyces sp. LBUM 1479]MBP5912642.1 family 43 glycosylhydrolase [Streptomyces sp. LBUM 1486]MDX2539561.1 family 43 glycosylhydrolase [Streptomyces scabiei]MDX2578077.1 family 43 glycosylhydrolase [Streptomyces scabiei]MDX2657508.1 family 43 glycosylhydrolase [Streptomyces scabiei]
MTYIERLRGRARRWAGPLAGLTAASLVLGLAGPAAPAAADAAGLTDGLALWYKLDATSGSKAVDASGHGRDGTVNGTAGWTGNGQGLSFNGSDTYIKVPNDVMKGMDSISVSMDVLMDEAQTGPYFIYGFGNSSSGTGNGYLFATGNSLRTAIASGNWSTEQNTRPSDGHNLSRSVWKQLTYTQTGTTGVLYEDGAEVGRNTSVTTTPGSIGAGTTTANYIGKSVYTGDKLFQGKIRDFRVYDRALAGSEVEQLALPIAEEGLAADKAALTLGDTSAVTADLTLPKTGTAGGSTITWKSDNTGVVSNSGAVTRPAAGEPNGHATLTATLKKGPATATKSFEVTVLPTFDDTTAVKQAAEALTVHNLDDVRGNLTLPGDGGFGTKVAWSSANPDVVSANGVVKRPAHGGGDTTAALTATVTKGDAKTTRTFTAKVPELPAKEALKGYMFSYFTGEGTSDGEQLYAALSKGNDPLKWRELNDGKPVLTSTLGEKGLRDPFIIRSPEGDKFYQIATDLKIYGNGDWDASQRTGSKSIMVWESTDLVHWTNQRLVKVSPDSAGNTWAPEAYYDDQRGEYVVFWASKLYDNEAHSGDTYNRMMYATTRDFYTFSEPKVWVDRGYSVIDSTVIQHDGEYYRLSKDERNNSSSTPNSKFIFEEKSDTLRSLSWTAVAEGIGKGTMSAAEGPLVFKSNTEDKWYAFLDEFGGRGYIPFETKDLDSGVWTPSTNYDLPSKPRHGTVLPVTQSEYDRLLKTYQPDGIVTSVEDVKVTTRIGDAPVLPATVIAEFADGAKRPVAVTWADVDPSKYAQAGTFTVKGDLPGDSAIEVRAEVTVSTGGPDVPADLLVHYGFDEKGGSIARDSSGHGYHGTYVRTPDFATGVDGGSFKMSGGNSGSSSPYVKIPNGVLKGADSVTVSTYAKWKGGDNWQWLFGLGPDSNKYLFASPSNGSSSLYSAITAASWGAEKKLSGARLTPGKWQHVTVTVDGGAKTAILYADGVEVSRATDVSVKPSDLYDANKDYSGYIGRSMYSPDPYFGGEVDDFRIYDRALKPAEILEISGNTTGIAKVTHPAQKTDAVIDDAGSRVTLPMKPGTDLTKLAPEFTLAHGAKISPASGTAQNFTKPVKYEVTGSDGKKRTWTVSARELKSPVLPGLNADPNIVRFGDTFYIYPTTDGFEGWSGTQFKAYSSKDLVNWKDHGVILDLGPDVSWADSRAWAPAMEERDGKYYFYFCADANIGVAVSDSPTGPFKDALGKPLLKAGTLPGQMIDPAVFTDDDGKSYLYWGNGRAYVVPLNDDMVSFDSAKISDITPSGYNEGTFVIKRKGTYYFMWSENDTRDENYQVAYATGSSPTGPWTKRGVILEKDLSLGVKGPGHHSVVHVPGTDDWYIAYHRFAIPGGDGTHRETTIDKLEFDADGLLKKVVPTLESIDPVTIARAGADVSGKEGSKIQLNGTVSGAGTAKWTAEKGAPCVFADAGSARTTITCADNGTYEVTLTGGRSSDTATVTVTNAAPEITSVSSGKTVETGKVTRVRVKFTDAGTRDEHTCRIDWKDGSKPAAGKVTAGSCKAEHTYRTAGLFAPVITVTDDDGASVSHTVAELVVYDRKAGGATGDGSFTSPAGAYPAGPKLTGKADFSFTAAYGKSGNKPSGKVAFDFAGAKLKFRSTSTEWLVVTGSEAVLQGYGTVNGKGGYLFRVTATDGPDTFQIKIWKKSDGKVVYDNRTASTTKGVTIGRK